MSRWKAFLESLNVILFLAAIVLILGLVVSCIAASFTGDGTSDGEQTAAVWIAVALLFTVIAGRIVDILRGKE